MRTVSSFAALAALCLATSAAAQGAPVADAFRDMAAQQAKNLVAAAEEMPEGKYGYKPTPAQMSFGDVINHLAEGNDYFCSNIGGVDAPKRADLAKDAGKDKKVARLKETFQFCETALAKLDDSKLGAKLPWFGKREISRAGMMLATAEDWGDHYSQLANYLRLNGQVPPTAKEKEE
jgi:uncharacterized damage-inducible protein DinB